MEKINWFGAYTLTLREVKRFMRVYNQTLLTPVISALIFLAVFSLSIGPGREAINNIKFINFMGYGLIAMSIIQNAFANSSSSFIMSKMLGYINDILLPPLGSTEIILAFTLGSVVRGVIVGIAVTISLLPFVEFTLHHPILLVVYVLTSCNLLGQMGLLSGLFSNSFDQHSAITSYLITPLSFLSGTFYSVSALPLIFQKINLINPFFYMIDGFRYCLTNYADGNIYGGLVFLITGNFVMYAVLYHLLNKGWRIKS